MAADLQSKNTDFKKATKITMHTAEQEPLQSLRGHHSLNYECKEVRHRTKIL
jgi:hypothetical protein